MPDENDTMPDQDTMPEQNEGIHTQPTAGRRAPAGEGVGAPFAKDSGGPPQMSVFDGAGNESVVVVGENESGQVAEGTGDNLEEALTDTEKGDRLGDAFNPAHTPK